MRVCDFNLKEMLSNVQQSVKLRYILLASANRGTEPFCAPAVSNAFSLIMVYERQTKGQPSVPNKCSIERNMRLNLQALIEALCSS